MKEPQENAKVLQWLAQSGLPVEISNELAKEIALQLLGLLAENRKNFLLLCSTEERLALAINHKPLKERETMYSPPRRRPPRAK